MKAVKHKAIKAHKLKKHKIAAHHAKKTAHKHLTKKA